MFASNLPARKLYQRLGFVEIGLRRDAYRIDADVVVDDVLMALKLRYYAWLGLLAVSKS